MKLKDFIRKLQSFDPELPVCITDWSEEYRRPSEVEAECIDVVTDYYDNNRDARTHGTFLQIGSVYVD